MHADETSWSLNSVWAFLSERARVLWFGVHKDAATLEQILDPATFAGIVVSDDAAIYANFTQSQKCWAHLLRKAIKLTLLEPANEEYRRLTDRLLEIYRTAGRVQRDRRLSAAGRAQKVADLDDEILELCLPMWGAQLPPLAGPADDYRLLCNELMRLMLAQQLFTFVTAPPVVTPAGAITPVAGTNNESERTLRSAAEARKTGRTNKTIRGARRQTIIVSVMESLRCYLPTFTLATVIHEIERWLVMGQSCFATWLGANRAQPTRRLTPRPRPTLAERMTSRPLRARSATPVAALRTLRISARSRPFTLRRDWTATVQPGLSVRQATWRPSTRHRARNVSVARPTAPCPEAAAGQDLRGPLPPARVSPRLQAGTLAPAQRPRAARRNPDGPAVRRPLIADRDRRILATR